MGIWKKVKRKYAEYSEFKKYPIVCPPGSRALIAKVKGGALSNGRNLSYLDEGALSDLAGAVALIEKRNIPGSIIETGCALGGSAIVMSGAKSRWRKLYCYDVFGLIPPPTEEDGEDVHARYAEIASGKAGGLDGARYYGYEEDLIDVVKANFAAFGYDVVDHNVTLVKGLYESTLFADGPVALAHIDCDWYDSVSICLERLFPYLGAGSILVIDDYEHYSGCKRAVDEFLDRYSCLFDRHIRGRLHLVRR